MDNNFKQFGEWRKLIRNKIVYDDYLVSSKGEIYSKKSNIIMSQFSDRDGYQLVHLHLNGKDLLGKVHRLVAEAFIPNPENKPQVNHINGIKCDNRVENLEWTTAKENVRHAFITGLRPSVPCGSDVKTGIYNDDEIHLVCKLLERKIPMKLISELSNVKYKTVTQIKIKKEWKCISDFYNIDSKYDSNDNFKICEVKIIKYSKLKKILIELNMFNRINLCDLLDSKYITHKKKLIEDLELLGYEIFLYKYEIDKIYKNDK